MFDNVSRAPGSPGPVGPRGGTGSMDLSGQLDSQVRSVAKVQPEQPDKQDLQVHPDRRDLQDLQEHQVYGVILEQLEHQGILDSLAIREHQVFPIFDLPNLFSAIVIQFKSNQTGVESPWTLYLTVTLKLTYIQTINNCYIIKFIIV